VIGIIDYGAGNLTSVGFALGRLGVESVRVRKPEDAEAAAGLLFPGVGRAGAARERLEAAGLWSLLCAWDRPLFGVCLGMQLLFEHSDEDDCPGLGLLPGRVRRLTPPGLKVPHMGWNQARPLGASFLGPADGPAQWFYFVHSYALLESAAACALTDYGASFVSAVQAGDLWGVQFHPERSGPAGARLLARFAERCGARPHP
jgi:imidazole glycerol phosphate synthase glutamine amidotransferase subunit